MKIFISMLFLPSLRVATHWKIEMEWFTMLQKYTNEHNMDNLKQFKEIRKF